MSEAPRTSATASPADVFPGLTAMRLLVTFCALAVGPELLRLMFVSRGWVLEPHDDKADIELTMAAFGLVAVGIGAFGLWQRPVRWSPARLRFVFVSYAPVFVAWTLLVLAYLFGLHALGHRVPPQAGLLYFSHFPIAAGGFWIVAGATVIAAPLAEEIVFRGYLHALLRTRLGEWPTIAIGGLLFGLVHGLDYALPIAVLGIYFGWLRERCGSLLASMTAHALHNGVVVIVTTCWPATLDWMYPQ